MDITSEISTFSPGSLVAGRFKIVRHIATGSMGTVFLALDSKLSDSEVALKVLHTKFVADQVAFKRFSNEVVFARKLTHTNIVRIYDFEESNSGQKLISMEYVAGTTLAQMIAELHGDVKNLDESSSLYEVEFQRMFEIYKKLLQGVAFAHRAGILHRDIKPCNILLDRNDEPKIGDFGLATLAGVSSGLTNDGQSLIGTPDYMAPEQVLGQRMTARSDIYSLGIMAFEILKGRPPFIGDSPLAVAYMQVQSPFPALERVPDFVPLAFLQLIQKATKKNPHERFSSVDEMIELLATNSDVAPAMPRRESASFGQRLSSSKIRVGARRETYSFPLPKFSQIILWSMLAVLLVALGTFTYHAINAFMELKDPPATMVVPTGMQPRPPR